VKLLIARGADVNLRGSGSMTPLDCALISGHEEIAALIREAGGIGRPLETLRKEQERRIKDMEEWAGAHRAKAQLESRDRILTEEDQQVIETVLLDLLSDRDPELFLRNTENPDIILLNKTAPWTVFLGDDQMNGELDDKQANEVSLEIREHLVQRNGEPMLLAGFKPTSPHIRLENEDAVPTRSRGFRREALTVRQEPTS